MFTYDTHNKNYLKTREGRNLPIPHCYIGTEGHELYGRIKEFKQFKNTFHYNKESFGISPKDMIKLSEDVGNDIDQIEFVGVVSNICVISNVVTFQSQYINAQIIIDSNFCASSDEDLHKKAMDVAESLQAKIIR